MCHWEDDEISPEELAHRTQVLGSQDSDVRVTGLRCYGYGVLAGRTLPIRCVPLTLTPSPGRPIS